MQIKKSIKFQTVNDVKRAKFDSLWHEGFRMTPLEKDEGDAPSDIVYMYAGNSQYVWNEGSRVVSDEDSLVESREYFYQNRDNISNIIYAVVHRLYRMPSLPYSFYEFKTWDKKQSNIDFTIKFYGAKNIKKTVLAHFKVTSFNELTRLLNAVSGEEFDLLVYGIKPDEED